MSTAALLHTQLTEHRIRVLLVDDSAMVGEAVRRMLAPHADIEFRFCQDPGQAIPAAEEFKPTVILQDLVMPEVDGMTLVKFFRARATTKDVPLIVLSSKEEGETKAEAFALGANDYMVKLPDPLEVLARIRYHSRGYINLLQRNEAYDALQASQKQLAGELAEAAEYVKRLLPAPLTTGSIRTEWTFIPSIALGGDSFYYAWLDEHRFILTLLDVCGHGVGAALLSISAINVLRAQAQTDLVEKPAEMLAFLNRTFPMDEHNDLYFTMWYAIFDTRTRTIRFANGGHPPAELVTATGERTQLNSPGFIVGGMPDAPFTEAQATVPPGSELYLFSDGVYEVAKADGSMLEYDDFAKELAARYGSDGDPIGELAEYARVFSERPDFEDDFSMVRFRFA